MSIQRLTCSNQGVRLQSAERTTFEKPSYPQQVWRRSWVQCLSERECSGARRAQVPLPQISWSTMERETEGERREGGEEGGGRRAGEREKETETEGVCARTVLRTLPAVLSKGQASLFLSLTQDCPSVVGRGGFRGCTPQGKWLFTVRTQKGLGHLQRAPDTGEKRSLFLFAFFSNKVQEI